MFNSDDLIFSYSRKQAIEDGVLVDVSAAAREVGIRYPVAITRAAWDRCVTVPPELYDQDEQGRLWDVIWLLACTIRRSQGEDEVRFAVHVRDENSDCTPPLVRLKALCGPGDAGEPVITVMLPDED